MYHETRGPTVTGMKNPGRSLLTGQSSGGSSAWESTVQPAEPRRVGLSGVPSWLRIHLSVD